MDFTVAVAAPVTVRINGQSYSVPRFLLPQMGEWAAKLAQEQLDRAIAAAGTIDAEARARLMMFWQDPIVDVLSLIQELRSPHGIEYVLRAQLDKAGVPAEAVEALLAYGDPMSLRKLADEIASARQAAAQLAADSGEPRPQGKN